MQKVMWQASGMTVAVFPELVRRPATAAASDPGDRAQRVLERAEQQAQALMESARRKAASLMVEAQREGLDQGRAEALAEARGRLEDLTQSLVAARDRLNALETECRSRCESLVVDLALTVAERVLGAHVAADPEAILQVVKGAVAALPSPDAVVVRVGPDAAALLQAHRDALQDAAPEMRGLRVVVDPTVAGGGCIVETPHSVVDATFPTQIGEARRRLQDATW